MNKRFAILSFSFLIEYTLSASEPVLKEKGFEVKPRCDIPGKAFESVKNTAFPECVQRCRVLKNCKAVTFVTHWNRCFIKDKISRLVPVSLISGEKSSIEQIDFDYTGKDFLKKVAKSSKQCAKHCQESSECLGFTFIKGYRTCWLKKSKGKFIKKHFYCAIKK